MRKLVPITIVLVAGCSALGAVWAGGGKGSAGRIPKGGADILGMTPGMEAEQVMAKIRDYNSSQPAHFNPPGSHTSSGASVVWTLWGERGDKETINVVCTVYRGKALAQYIRREKLGTLDGDELRAGLVKKYGTPGGTSNNGNLLVWAWDAKGRPVPVKGSCVAFHVNKPDCAGVDRWLSANVIVHDGNQKDTFQLDMRSRTMEEIAVVAQQEAKQSYDSKQKRQRDERAKQDKTSL